MDRVANLSQQARLSWRIQNTASREADIDVFDVIGADGFWEDGVKASDFVKELRAIDADLIRMHINSPGGYVNDALAMFNAVQQHPAEVHALIESQAASAASFLAMAADRIFIAKHAQMFIHDAHGFGIGNASDFRALADMLDEESQNIANIYAERTGKSGKHWRDEMQANNGIGTSYRGQAAVDAGLADELLKATPRNVLPMRPAAMKPAASEPDEDITATLAEALKAAKLQPPEPTLEALLGKYSLKEAVAGAAPGGNHG